MTGDTAERRFDVLELHTREKARADLGSCNLVRVTLGSVDLQGEAV
jgi:hypothetical protein